MLQQQNHVKAASHVSPLELVEPGFASQACWKQTLLHVVLIASGALKQRQCSCPAQCSYDGAIRTQCAVGGCQLHPRHEHAHFGRHRWLRYFRPHGASLWTAQPMHNHTLSAHICCVLELLPHVCQVTGDMTVWPCFRASIQRGPASSAIQSTCLLDPQAVTLMRGRMQSIASVSVVSVASFES